MDQPHRARQIDLRCLDDDHLALDAAQLRLLVARGQAAAVDHDAVEIFRARIAAELDGAAGGFDAGMQFGEHAARLDMALVGIEQAVAETAIQRRFEVAQRLRVEPDMAGGQFRKTFEIGAVARMRHDQRAVEGRFGEMLAPQIERADAEPADDGLGGLGLAPGRQHAAGPVAGGERHTGVTALIQSDGMAGPCEQQRLPCAGNARTDDGNGESPRGSDFWYIPVPSPA